MINKNTKTNSVSSPIDDEQRLQTLLQQHEQISQEIIAIVLKTTTEAEHLIQTLDRQISGQMIHPLRGTPQKPRLHRC